MEDLNMIDNPFSDKTSRAGSVAGNIRLVRRCGVFQISDALRTLHPTKREYTFMSAAKQASTRIDRALISRSLLPGLESASHKSPDDLISDHGSAIRVAFRCSVKAKLGPGVWRFPSHLLNRPGVRKVVEAAAKQSMGDYALLLAQLNAGLRAYAKEEGKREAAKQLGIVSDSGRRMPYLGYADDTTLLLQGREQIAEAGKMLDYFENVYGNHASEEGCFILWGKETIFATREEGGVGVKDPGVLVACLATRRIGILLTERDDFKRDMMLAAAGLPLGVDTFLSHEKLLKYWVDGSARWKQTCECFMSSSFATVSIPLTAAEVVAERLVFNKGILLNGRTPVGGQKAAKALWEIKLGDLVAPMANGGMAVKSEETLAMSLGIASARLALKGLAAAPENWRELLLASSEGIQGAVMGGRAVVARGGKLFLTLIFHLGQVAPIKHLRLAWRRQGHSARRREKWANRWGGTIDWKQTSKIRDSLTTPSYLRDVLIRVHNFNLQVGERLAFLSSKPKCPYCSEEESLEHCLFECPRIQPIMGALKTALKMLNPRRTISSLGDLLFG
ncbi:unnamed protein product [Closterium sp. NIES-65]|nr:unnamed protein product [Closterium sp. NIES-65]